MEGSEGMDGSGLYGYIDRTFIIFNCNNRFMQSSVTVIIKDTRHSYEVDVPESPFTKKKNDPKNDP